MRPNPSQVADCRRLLEQAIKNNPHLKDTPWWLRAGREYPSNFDDLPPEIVALPKEKIHFIKSRLRHKYYRCALLNKSTGEILLAASNYKEMIRKVIAFAPVKGLLQSFQEKAAERMSRQPVVDGTTGRESDKGAPCSSDSPPSDMEDPE